MIFCLTIILLINTPYAPPPRWTLQDPPDWLQEGMKNNANANPGWSSLDDVLDPSRDQSILTQLYRQHIENHIEMNGRYSPESLLAVDGTAGGLAAAVVEPLLQGAGGMLLVDPQFQRAMVQVRLSYTDSFQRKSVVLIREVPAESGTFH